MSAALTKKKNPINSKNFLDILSTFNTEGKSCLFMKQLTTTCISTILYSRHILPEEYFEVKNFEGIPLKLLKLDSKIKYSENIHKWLEGAFDAIDKKYLKHLMLDIKDRETKMLLEIYTMTFCYKSGNETMNFLLSKNKQTWDDERKTTILNSQMKTTRLLEMCDSVTRSCGRLPPQITLSIRLSYYNDTPANYQPSGYKAWEPDTPVFPTATRSVEIGVTSTKHHFFRLVNKSCFIDNFFRKLEGLQNEKETKAKRELLFTDCEFSPPKQSDIRPKRLKISPNIELTPKRMKTDSHGSIFKNTNNGEELVKIRCPCLSNERTETMLKCLNCKYMAHAECFGFLPGNLLNKNTFFCTLCHVPGSSAVCHDKMMINFNEEVDKQKLAIFRRFLKYCLTSQNNKITLDKMKKIAFGNCTETLREITVNKGIEIGVLTIEVRNESYLINKDNLIHEISNYFYIFPKHPQYNLKTIRYESKRRTADIPSVIACKKNCNADTNSNITCINKNLQFQSQDSPDLFC